MAKRRCTIRERDRVVDSKESPRLCKQEGVTELRFHYRKDDPVCLGCGFDLRGVVLKEWTVRFQGKIHSANTLPKNRRGFDGIRYSHIRDSYANVLGKIKIPKAKALRRVFIVRQYGKRKRAYDQDNMHAGCKPLLDSISKHGWIIDDKPKWCEFYGRQERNKLEELDHIILVIQDIKSGELQ